MHNNHNKEKILSADKIEITTIIDNHIDLFLKNEKYVNRFSIFKNDYITNTPVAEHGLSLLIKVYKDSKYYTVLLDAGYSNIGVTYNAKLLGINLSEIDYIVLSHGHMDHYGSLLEVLKETNKNTPLVLHPDAFFLRGFKSNDEKMYKFPTLSKQEIIDVGTKLIITKKPYFLASNLALTTGEIPRYTEFEKAPPSACRMSENKIELDPILDDLGLIFNVKDKGLVVISGCAHAGIINTIYHARKLTGINKIHAILGGFHLCGNTIDEATCKTIQEFKTINPEVIVPMHCTSWPALNAIAKELPKQFILNTVGSTYVFD